MADCSQTEVFFAEWERMHKHYENELCAGCSVRALANAIGEKDCIKAVFNMPKELVIGAVQRWSDAHPLPKPKTYEDELKKLLPASLLYRKNMDGKQEVYLCRQMLFDSEPPYCNGYIVDKVCMKCWNEPYPQQGASV